MKMFSTSASSNRITRRNNHKTCYFTQNLGFQQSAYKKTRLVWFNEEIDGQNTPNLNTIINLTFYAFNISPLIYGKGTRAKKL